MIMIASLTTLLLRLTGLTVALNAASDAGGWLRCRLELLSTVVADVVMVRPLSCECRSLLRGEAVKRSDLGSCCIEATTPDRGRPVAILL